MFLLVQKHLMKGFRLFLTSFLTGGFCPKPWGSTVLGFKAIQSPVLEPLGHNLRYVQVDFSYQ